MKLWLRPPLARIVITTILASGAGITWAFWRDDAPAGDSLAPMDMRVHALGHLEPGRGVLAVSAPSGSESPIVQHLVVEEGDDLLPGQLLAVLDNRERRSALKAQAEARLAVAQAKVALVKAGSKPSDLQAQRSRIAALEHEAARLEREFARARELIQQKAVAAEELDRKRSAYDQAVLKHREALETLTSLEQVRPEDILVAEEEVAAARASLLVAEKELAACEVRAPIAGRVLKIHARGGERIGDKGLLEMGNVAEMVAVAEVFEGDIPRVTPSSKVTVTLDSTGSRFQGEVAEIGWVVGRKNILSNDPVSDTDARVVEVRVRLIDPPRVVERLSNARVEISFPIEKPVKGSTLDFPDNRNQIAFTE